MMNDQKSSSSLRRVHVLVSGTLFLVAALVLAAISQVYAGGHHLSIAGYLGFSYGPLGVGAVKEHPTGEKPESKLWWHDGMWWGSLFNAAEGVYQIYRYDTGSHNWVTTGTAIDPRLESRADVLWDGAKLYIVSHIKQENPSQVNEEWAWLFRYSYDAGAKTYNLDGGFPVQAVNQDKTETLVIDKDSAGRLWVTYVSREQDSNQYQVYVNSSQDDGLTWGAPFVLPLDQAAVTVHRDDISSLIAFSDQGGPKIGVMWSNQLTDKFYFAIHPDNVAAADGGWMLEEINFPYPANDHVNLAKTASGRVLAAVKSIEPGVPERPEEDPLIVVIARDVDGTYSFHTVSLVKDKDTRPIIVINEESNQAHVFATSKVGGGTVCRWSAFISTPLANMTFPVGNCPPTPQSGGAVIVLGDDTYERINNVTSTKQRVNSQTDLLILAADEPSRVYVHNYLAQEPPVKIYLPLIAR
jgi:hypothetical protein